MRVSKAVESRIELKEFSEEQVDVERKREILHAGRLAPSGRNLQHWRFIIIDDSAILEELAAKSPSGQWVSNADFAIAICTDPTYDFNQIDAARAVTHMQLVAWEHGIGSRIYTVDQPAVNTLLDIPNEYELTLVAGFGYPQKEVKGIKNRNELEEIAFHNRFDNPISRLAE